MPCIICLSLPGLSHYGLGFTHTFICGGSALERTGWVSGIQQDLHATGVWDPSQYVYQRAVRHGTQKVMHQATSREQGSQAGFWMCLAAQLAQDVSSNCRG